MRIVHCGIICALGLSATVQAIDVPGVDGTALSRTFDTNTVLDLGLAVDGDWETTADTGDGVYDADVWAVVFKFSSVTIDPGVTVSFVNHPSGAPVVWLVAGNATINGTLSVSAPGGSTTFLGQPGPGGFRGGAGRLPQAAGMGGLGPGAGRYVGGLGGTGGSHGQLPADGILNAPGAPYGNERIVPLVGGSGGSASGALTSCGGAGGGGAVLIAAEGAVTINGTIEANGGNVTTCFGNGDNMPGGGSGGSIRIVCDSISGSSGVLLSAQGGSVNQPNPGAAGRIRIEAGSIALMGGISPNYTSDQPDDPAVVFPTLSEPTLTPTHFSFDDGQPDLMIPADPRAEFTFPEADAPFETTQDVTLHITSTNIPTNGDWTVTVLVVPRTGNSLSYVATYDDVNSEWVANFEMPRGFSGIQIRADEN